MRGNLTIAAYNADWPSRFEQEQTLLESVLGPWLHGGIHHVGSTSVPGLGAKPVIDMIAGVDDLERARGCFSSLASLGYTYREHRPEAHCFAKPGDVAWWEQTHALHLTEPGSDLWRERLAFRDALRSDPALAAEYEAWKLRHAAVVGEPGPYSASKNPFVTRVLASHGIHIKRDSARLTSAALHNRRGP